MATASRPGTTAHSQRNNDAATAGDDNASTTSAPSSSASSSSSSSSSYQDQSTNDLSILSSAALITADCLGTGILALPADIAVLGLPFGLTFLILNLPINLYAGTILGRAAKYVERRLLATERDGRAVPVAIIAEGAENGESQHQHQQQSEGVQQRGTGGSGKRKGYASLETSAAAAAGPSSSSSATSAAAEATQNTDDDRYHGGGSRAGLHEHNDDAFGEEEDDNADTTCTNASNPKLAAAAAYPLQHHHNHHPTDVHTTDFIGMTTALFSDPSTSFPSPSNASSSQTTSKAPTRIVTAVYYTNIFLVLGNYILVMSHSVAAMVGEENICLPTAGIIASVLMYALAQLRTMANLGRSASVISLTALGIVVVMCLLSIERGDVGLEEEEGDDRRSLLPLPLLLLTEGRLGGQRGLVDESAQGSNGGDANSDGESASDGGGGVSIAQQLAALASIGFAVGSQKLLLNIRHEMKVRDDCAPRALGISLSVFGVAYVTVCLLAGSDPPTFLFDAIDEGPARKLAGFLLWVHVAVSFAINSQALTSSIDRVHFHRVTALGLHNRHRLRWAVLTLIISLSSYFVANAVPFFKDLVALIGALTSVPLTLLLPAILYRRVIQVPMFALGSRHELASYLLIVFSIVFLICGCFGAIDSIFGDWEHKSKPFSCH